MCLGPLVPNCPMDALELNEQTSKGWGAVLQCSATALMASHHGGRGGAGVHAWLACGWFARLMMIVCTTLPGGRGCLQRFWSKTDDLSWCVVLGLASRFVGGIHNIDATTFLYCNDYAPPRSCSHADEVTRTLACWSPPPPAARPGRGRGCPLVCLHWKLM